MNANELANEIDKFLQEAEQLPWGTKQVYLDQSATMLRQLQAENEALKNALSDEIIDAAIMYADLSGFGSNYSEGLSDGFEQAKAILRKAQEK